MRLNDSFFPFSRTIICMKQIIIVNEFEKNRKIVVQFFFLRFSTYSYITGNAHHQINGGKKTNI